MSEAGTAPWSAGEVAAWSGFEVDEVGGARVGRVGGSFVDADGGAPVWLVVVLERRGFLGRRSRGAVVVVPIRECACAAGRVWTALDAAALRSAPAVDPYRALLREHEAALCEHYGIGEADGRHAEIAPRPPGAITAHPPA